MIETVDRGLGKLILTETLMITTKWVPLLIGNSTNWRLSKV